MSCNVGFFSIQSIPSAILTRYLYVRPAMDKDWSNTQKKKKNHVLLLKKIILEYYLFMNCSRCRCGCGCLLKVLVIPRSIFIILQVHVCYVLEPRQILRRTIPRVNNFWSPHSSNIRWLSQSSQLLAPKKLTNTQFPTKTS